MALNFALHTTNHPTLSQVLVATEDGLFDYKAQQAANKVVVSANEPRKAATLRSLKHPSNGLALLSET